jgi:hypothetical protein
MSSKLFHIQILLAHTKQILLSHSHSTKLALKIQKKKKNYSPKHPSIFSQTNYNLNKLCEPTTKIVAKDQKS